MPVSTSDIDITESYPTIRPSLNLNFARSRALDPRISFERSHTNVVAATYIGRDGQVKRAGVNEPRFEHDYDTGESLGLLIEESRTNFCGDAIPSTADWSTLNNSSIISTTALAPDGTNTAFRYQGSATAPASLLRIGLPAFTTGTDTYTISFYVKQVVANTQTGQNLICDLQDGGPSVNYSSQLVQDKWVRVVQTGTTTSGNKTFFDMVSNTLNDGTYDFWGLQIEQGSFATSLILTTDSTAGTRGADNAEVLYDGWYDNNSSVKPSTFVGKFQTYNLTSTRIVAEGANSSTFRDFSMNTMSNNDELQFVHRYTLSNSYDNSEGANITANTPVTFAFSFDGTGGDITGSANGTTPIVGTDDLGVIQSGGDRMRIGSRGNNTLYLNGTISELKYYKFKASSAQLLLLQ